MFIMDLNKYSERWKNNKKMFDNRLVVQKSIIDFETVDTIEIMNY